MPRRVPYNPVAGPDSTPVNTPLPDGIPVSCEVVSTGPAEQTPSGALMILQQQALRQLLSDPTPLTRESFVREMTVVARAAVTEGQYAAAAKLYELAGKNLGAIDPDKTVHQHVHITTKSKDSDFARATDEELRRIIAEAQGAR